MISPLCDDLGLYINILSLIITGMEYLAVSCMRCMNIRLINLQDEDQKPIVAYTSQEKEFGPMCLGEAGTLYTVGKYFDVVSVLDCSTTTFILKSRLPPIKDFNAQDICYMDRAGFIALSSSGLGCNDRISAVSSDGRVVWDISSQIDDMRVIPRTLVYLSDQDLLLVDDSKNKRIIVVTGSAGYIVQVIHVYDGLEDLHTKDNRLIAFLKSRRRMSFYTVS